MELALPSRVLDRRDLDFLLFEMLEVERLCSRPRFAEHSRATFAATHDAEASAEASSDFYRGKLAAARRFFRWELPSVAPKHALLRSLDSTCLDLEEAWL